MEPCLIEISNNGPFHLLQARRHRMAPELVTMRHKSVARATPEEEYPMDQFRVLPIKLSNAITEDSQPLDWIPFLLSAPLH